MTDTTHDDLVKRLRFGACAIEIEQAADRIEELEAKLAKALALLESLDNQVVWESIGLGNDMTDRVEATLAELKGETS